MRLVGEKSTIKVDAIDPDDTFLALDKLLGDSPKRRHHAKLVCPLGTKPQTVGIYSHVRICADPPALVYASPLRHNHDFFSHGVGKTWILKTTL